MSNRLTKGKGLFGAIAATTQTVSGLLTVGSLNLGTDTLKDIVHGTANVVHGTILPGGIGTIAQALAGLAAGDGLLVNPGALTGGLVWGHATPGAGTMTSYLTNPTSGTVSPGTFSVTYTVFDFT